MYGSHQCDAGIFDEDAQQPLAVAGLKLQWSLTGIGGSMAHDAGVSGNLRSRVPECRKLYES